MGRPRPVTEDQSKEIVRLYQAGISRNSLALQFNTSRPFITDLLKEHGVRVRGSKEVCTVTLPFGNIFKNANESEAAAYWIGFLMADGCVHRVRSGSKYIRLALAVCDKPHVEKFAAFIGVPKNIQVVENDPKNLNGHVIRGTATAVYSLASESLVDELFTYGVVYRKTHSAEVCLLGDNRHFWRGVIDGDGSIGTACRWSVKQPTLQFACGSRRLVEQFRDYCKSFIETKADIHRNRKLWAFTLSAYPAAAAIHSLYFNCSISLDRKQHSANEILSRYMVDGKLIEPPTKSDHSHLTAEHLQNLHRELDSNWAAVARRLDIHPASLVDVKRRVGLFPRRGKRSYRRQ